MDFYDWLIIVGLGTGVIVSLSLFKRLPLAMKYLSLFFYSTFGLEVIADFHMLLLHQNNLVYYHIMTISQYTFLSLLFRESISDITIKQWILLSIFSVILFEGILLLTVADVTISPSWIRLIVRLLLLYWILSYLKTILNSEIIIPLLSIPVFWVCLGLLVYFISFLQVGLMKYMIATNRAQALSWYNFSICFDTVFYLICSYSLWLAARLNHHGK